jgi:ADP-heptose:LPS heptosyltransferase
MFRKVAESVHPVSPEIAVETKVIEIPPEVGVRTRELLPSPQVVVLYVGASVNDRRWPSTRFAAVADYVIRAWSASVLIVAGASAPEVTVAEETKAAVRESNSVEVLTGLGIPELAALFRSVEMLISNDSGPMHIGSAVGVPTLGIFSRSLPEHYRPVGGRDRYVKKNSVEEVSVEEVVEVLEGMRATAVPDRRL